MSNTHITATLTEDTSSRFVQTKRWKLHYNEAGSGFPIIALHGTGPGATGWSNFHQNVPALAAKNRLIMLDFPGWGLSDPFDSTDEPRDLANAAAVKLLMDELGLEKAALVGNSMGGMATLIFATTYPDRISHAVTMGSGLFALPHSLTPRGLSQGMQIIVETYREPTPENFRRLVDVMVYDSSLASDELAQQRSAVALQRPEHLENWLRWWNGPSSGIFRGIEELLGSLSKTSVPTLMIHGRDDRTVAMETTLHTAALLPDARTVIFNRCGHWAQLEQAAEFNRLVTSFIAAEGA